MIRTLIIDDEQRCRETLITVLSEFPDVMIVEQCSTADAGINAIYRHHPELVFLDVEMPSKTGLEMLSEIKSITFDIIFTTAHDKYSLQAIKASALDYLLKPIGRKDLAEALDRFRKKRKLEDISKQVEVLLQFHAPANNKIALATVSGIEFVSVNAIVRLQSDVNYTSFFLEDFRKIIVAKTLKEFEELLLPYNIIRIHKSHLVNLHFVKKFMRGEGTLVLDDGTGLPVSPQRKEELLRRMKGAL